MNSKVKAIVALVVALAFSMASCTGGGKSFNSADDLKAYLDKQPVNGPDKPIKVSMTINDPMFKNVAHVIRSAGKYVSLNISGNALTEISDRAFYDCTTLVSINIPSSVTYIGEYAFWGCDSFTSIKVEGTTLSFYENSFDGDLFTKLKAEGLGTYTTEKPGRYAKWTKQGTSSRSEKITPPSGTYVSSDYPSWTITFDSGSATVSNGADTAKGTYTVSGKSLLLTANGETEEFTINDSNTLTDSFGYVWGKKK